jgi:hypothetical protein
VEQFFTSLSKRQTMLLLTSLAFGGSEAVNAYAHLDAAEEELLKYRAAGLLQIPRDKRIPLLVQEIKRLVTQRRRQLGSADPKRLGALLKNERSSVVEVVLNALPADLAVAVRAELGNPPPVKLQRDVKPEVLSIIRWKLEDALRANAPAVGSFRFSDLMMMQQREILAVADRMGARVLATAVAGLGDEERAAFLAKLPPDQRQLAQRAAEAGAARRLTEKDARLVLEMHGALEDPSLGLRSAGVQRVVRACYAQGAEFAQRFAERHQGDLGKLLQRWLKEEKGKPVKGDGGRLDIVEQLERLAQKSIIDRPMRLPPPMKAPAMPPPPLRPPPQAGTSAQRALAAPPQPGTSAQRSLTSPSQPGTSANRVLTAPPQKRSASGAQQPRPPGAPTGPRAASERSGERPPPRDPDRSAERAAPRDPDRSAERAAPREGERRPPDGKRLDPIAAREARRAGAASGMVPKHQAAPRGTDPARQRIMRDGKPLERNDALDTVPPRRQTSPVAPIPKRRDPAGRSGSSTAPGRSPVLKGSGRGPDGGSR